MKNRTENTDTSTCTTWCEQHEDEGWCTSRPVEVGGTYLEVSNGTTSGNPLVFGLNELGSDGVDLATAERAARAILELVEEARR